METDLKKWIVYCTTNIVNNKIYVGVHKTENCDVFDGYIGCNVKVNNPSSYQKPTTPFQFAVKKYGIKNFKRAIIKANLTKKEAFKLEGEIVNLEFVKRKDTYNVAIGGNGGKPGKAVNQFDFSGKLLKKWDSIVEVCEFYNTAWMAVYNAVFYKTSKLGYYWSFSNEIDPTKFVNNAGTRIYSYNGETGNILNEYESFHEASRDLKIPMCTIQNATRGGYKTHGVYFSKQRLEKYTGMETVNIRNKVLYVYTLPGEFIAELKTTKEILNFFSIKTTNGIQRALRGQTPFKGYQISLEKEERLPEVKDPRKLKKAVGEYSLTGDLLNTYETVTKARKVYGAGVSRCLRGQQKTCHNLIFKYIS